MSRIKSILNDPFIQSEFLYRLIQKINCKSLVKEIKLDQIKKNNKIIFIFGSGYSINNITLKEWEDIKNVGDSLSFNFFFLGKFIPISYHIFRETGPYISLPYFLLNLINNYMKKIFKNDFYKKTIFFTHFDEKSLSTIWAVYILKLFRGKKICFYKNIEDRLIIKTPSDSIDSIPHCGSTLFDAINLAYLLEYSTIVLVGVDLYDRRYFWLNVNETRDADIHRGNTCFDMHNTTQNVIDTMRVWYPYLLSKGVKLYIYNPKSLLAGLIPVFSFNQIKKP